LAENPKTHGSPRFGTIRLRGNNRFASALREPLRAKYH
jgi:hypothetical protein